MLDAVRAGSSPCVPGTRTFIGPAVAAIGSDGRRAPADADDSIVNLRRRSSPAGARSGGRVVGAVGDPYAAGAGKLVDRRPPSSPPARCIYRVKAPRDVEEGAKDADSRSSRTGAG